MAYGELFCNLPESKGKCLPCKDMPFRDNFNSPTEEQILPPYRNCGSLLTAPNLTAAAANLAPAPSHHSHSFSPANPALAARARTPRTPPPHLSGRSRGHSPARPGSQSRDTPASRRDFLGEPASSRVRPTHLCFLHKERQRCDPAQAAVWRLRLAVLELQHIARAAAADSPRIG